MAKNSREAAKLLKTLRMVQQGFIRSEKYARLFDSHISMVSIHEASHAVIATLLGLNVAMVEIEIEENERDGRRGITSGLTVLEPSERERLVKDHQGRVIQAAILLASILTKDYKFEWHIEKHLVDAGFDGDNSMLQNLDDDVAVRQGGVILWWAFCQPFVIDMIESVAEVLNEKKVMFGAELREIVFNCESPGSGAFSRKGHFQGTRMEGTATVLSEPESTQFKFLGMELVVTSLIAKDHSRGEIVLGFVELVTEPVSDTF